MILSSARIHRIIPLTILAAFGIIAVSLLAASPLKPEVDIDASITNFVMFGITVIVFISSWKYENVILHSGLALVLFTTGIHIIEEYTREFSVAGLFWYSALLITGFLLVCAGIVTSRRTIDIEVEHLRIQERTIRAHAENLGRLGSALEQANRKLRLLTQITRHDIGNMLHAASGYLSLLMVRENPEDTGRYLKRLENALQAIGQIVAFTKDYEEIGLQAPEWQKIWDLVESAKLQSGRESIRIENDIDPLLEVYADTMLSKVFYNLIDNALSHGGEGLTSVRFSARKTGEGLILICEDNGCGIPEEEKDRIFLRGVGKHTGLGLFLSKEILSMTGIAIRETGQPHSGARFEMLVPEDRVRAGTSPA